jgi:(p)ppGpp synthase/HD superfamily hydrolase
MHPLINKAIKFASRAHHGQFRKGSDFPYISHPIGVAFMLLEAKASTEQIVAGILHDVVEDTNTSLAEIRQEFGDKVAELVEACSEYDPTAKWEVRKKQTHDFLRTASAEVHLIVCADKLHNLQSISEDYEMLGEAVWKKFSRGKEAQAWYYRELMNILCKEIANHSDNSLFHQLQKAVNEVFG